MKRHQTTLAAFLAVLLGAPSTPTPTTTRPTIFGMNATTAVVVGLVLLLVIVLAIVAVSKNNTTVTRPY